MSYPAHLQLSPWTPVAQRRTWTPDETYVAERTHECAQACITSIFRWATGLWVPAAYLHDLIHPVGATLDTTLAEVQETFAINETLSTLHFPQGINELESILVGSINRQHPVILLRHFETPQSQIGHFTVCTGYSTSVTQQMDPWTGTMFTEGWQAAFDMFWGACIVVHRKRMLGNH